MTITKDGPVYTDEELYEAACNEADLKAMEAEEAELERREAEWQEENWFKQLVLNILKTERGANDFKE